MHVCVYMPHASKHTLTPPHRHTPDFLLGTVREHGSCGEENKEAYFMGSHQMQNYNKDEVG